MTADFTKYVTHVK